MTSRESALFAAAALPAGSAALAWTAWLAVRQGPAMAAMWPEILIASLLSVMSYVLSFSASGRDRTSLELAYFLAAILTFPSPAPLVVAAITGLLGSAFRASRRLGVLRFASIAGANIAVAVGVTYAAMAGVRLFQDPLGSWVPSLLPLPVRESWRLGMPVIPTLLLSAVLFFVMTLANLFLMTIWVALRGESPWNYARGFFTRMFPVELINIPFGCVLAFALRSGSGVAGFLMVGSLGVAMSYLLKRISDSEDDLRAANANLTDRVGELATLNAIGRQISSSLDTGRVFEVVREECRRVFRPDYLWIAIIDPDSLVAHVKYSAADSAPSRTTTVTCSEGLAALALGRDEPLLVRDAPVELAVRDQGPLLPESNIRSILAVPLHVDNRAVGVLCVQAFRPGAYDEHHVSLLTTIGQQVAVALENARHYQLATVDQLTGLFQRDYFFQRLGDEHKRALRYGTGFSILMLDLDSFKSINDRFGHLAGDRFLRAVGATLKEKLRASDVPCRYGGEEFCVLLPETDPAGARIIAEKIRSEIGALRVPEGPHRLATTLSAGVASYPAHFDGSLTGLMQKADQALYAAKKDGKDRVRLAA